MEEEKSLDASMDCGESSFVPPQLWVHPSTLVSIGEHGTRLLYKEEVGGGEEGSYDRSLDASGLLWGSVRSHENGSDQIEVWDAEDAPHGDSKPLERVIDPLQVVVGWYRIASIQDENAVEAAPTADDLLRAQQWQQRYAPNATAPFLFVLLSYSNSGTKLSFYMLPVHASVLRSLDDPSCWSGRTAPSERLAVERLFHVTPPAWPELDARLQPIEEALQQPEDVPSSAVLRRQVQGLLDHLALGPAVADTGPTSLLPTLAALAQCVAATQPYLEKHRCLLPTPSADPESMGPGRGPAGERHWRTARRYAPGAS